MTSYGWVGKYIRVDLSKGRIQIGSSKDLLKRFIGGKGIGQWLLFNHLSPNVNPLDPENLLNESGRGIFLIRNMMDKLDFKFTDKGTEVIAIKYL